MSPENKVSEFLENMGRGSKAKLAKYLNTSPVNVTRWLTDSKYGIPKEYYVKIAKFLKISVDDLLGNDEIKVKIKTIPLIGIASCGVPYISYDDIIEHIPVPAELARDGVYAVKADGDSMLPKISHGDIIICDKEMICENGNIVHYTTADGESGLKKYLIDDAGVVTLMPLNSDFPPVMCDKNELRCARAIRLMQDL